MPCLPACVSVPCPWAPCWNDAGSCVLHVQRGFSPLRVIIVLSVSLPVKRWESYFGETQGFVSRLRSLQ